MRTVIQFIDNLQAGGKERQCVELAKALALRGDTRCIVVSMSEAMFFRELESTPGVHLVKLVRRWRQDPWVAVRFLALCRRWRADVVHAWHVMPALYALPACRLLGIPLVAGFVQDAPATLDERLRRRSRIAFRWADAVVGNSRAGVRAYAAPPAKTRTIPSGFDLRRVAQTPDAQWLRRHHDIDTPLVVGMVATFSGYKDHPTFVDAARRVLARRDDVTFVMVGGGPTQAAVAASIPEPLRRRIRVLGRIEAPIEQVVAGLDVGVLATFTEGISNSIVEYMVLEKPVVASAGSGNDELVTDGCHGWLVPPSDPQALADRVQQLLDDPEMRRRMGRAGRERVLAQYRMEVVVDAFEALYDEIGRARR